MLSRSLRIFLVTVLLLGTIYATVVQADEGEGGGEGEAYKETPVQVIVEIVITGITLKILNKFDLP